MKKTLTLLTAIFMVFAISSIAKALEGNPANNGGLSQDISVSATVNPYCSVTIDAPEALTFTGKAGEEQKSFGKIVKDCNTDTIVEAKVTQPLTNGNYVIDTKTKVDADDGTGWGITSSMNNYYDGNVHRISLGLKGKLGNKVSSQPAGQYTGTITVTVSALQ